MLNCLLLCNKFQNDNISVSLPVIPISSFDRYLCNRYYKPPYEEIFSLFFCFLIFLGDRTLCDNKQTYTRTNCILRIRIIKHQKTKRCERTYIKMKYNLCFNLKKNSTGFALRAIAEIIGNDSFGFEYNSVKVIQLS